MKYTLKLSLFLLLVLSCSSFLFAEDDEDSFDEFAKQQRIDFIEEAKTHLGKPYSYGSVGPNAFDCSGFVYYCTRKALHKQLPRTSSAMYYSVQKINDSEREPGDLLFFRTTSSSEISHVGIYLGNNQFISALNESKKPGIAISKLNNYWKGKYVGAGRIIEAAYEKNKSYNEKFAYDLDDYSNDSYDEYYDDYYNDYSISRNKSAKAKSVSSRNGVNSTGSFFVFDGTVEGDWSFIRPSGIEMMFRGINVSANARFALFPFQPGIGFGFSYDAGLNVFQIPITISFTLNDFWRIYYGPIFTFGNPYMFDRETYMNSQIFPGTFGIAFTTPAITIGQLKLQLCQDISYTIYGSSTSGYPLSFLDYFSAGFVLRTGIRISIPSKMFAGF